MSNHKTHFYKLREISEWQLDPSKSKVSLPALQRGFVWKVSQIESLWDSIFRGYPLGSFLLSESVDDTLLLLDGQQRATSIALGYYNPWDYKTNNFWSLKNIPVTWVDLSPNQNDKTISQKFVIRVVTQSHPWGYQRKDNKTILTVSDRNNALKLFREYPKHKDIPYIKFDLSQTYPYDADLPIPLVFLIKSISENHDNNWKRALIELCRKELPTTIITKHSKDKINIVERLSSVLNDNPYVDSIVEAITNLDLFEIPCISVKQEILKSDDEQPGEDPTLFVRLNASGTRIAGEELIYSIYKASFPKAKELVENIGAGFLAPSLVISLVTRLALADINGDTYPNTINVNEFRKKIKDDTFKNKLKDLIGDNKETSPARILFKKAIDILLSKNEIDMPPILVKSTIKNSPDLFLILLQWLKLQSSPILATEEKKILAAFTSLAWFGRDNSRYVRELWSQTSKDAFWSKTILSQPFVEKKDYIMYPLIHPDLLKKYLLENVVTNNLVWDNLYPSEGSEIISIYSSILDPNQAKNEIYNEAKGIWDSFISKLFWCKSLILFAQRTYINKEFGEFNQMETIEDTNTPWDWDHIYPNSWVYRNWNIAPNTRHWTNSIGNFRALALEENRSEGAPSPKSRLSELAVRQKSFINENDWEYWDKIDSQIHENNPEMVKNHLGAIINRLCNIYGTWYDSLDVGLLFNHENKIV